MNRPLRGMIREVCEFEGGPQPMYYECRGHVKPKDFVAELAREFGLRASVDDVHHRYARNVPVGRDMPGVMTQMVQNGPGRGAYKITFIDACNADQEVTDDDD